MAKLSPKVSILFVCMGNICRSPTAQGIFQSLVSTHGLEHDVLVDSAGTHAYHEGKKPDIRAIKLAQSRGYDFTYMRARKVVEEDFQQFDYIIAMDQQNQEELRASCPSEHKQKIQLMLDYHNEEQGGEVPDPYYRDLAAFEMVFNLIEVACKNLLMHLHKKHQL